MIRNTFINKYSRTKIFLCRIFGMTVQHFEQNLMALFSVIVMLGGFYNLFTEKYKNKEGAVHLGLILKN